MLVPIDENKTTTIASKKKYDYSPKTSLFSKITLINAILALLFLCLIITLFVRYRLIFLAISDIGGIESNVIYSIQRFMAGFPLYTNPATAPYSITQYSPLYYRIIAFFGSVLSISPDYTLAIYQLSRVVSLTANIFYAFLLFGLTYKVYPNSKVGICIAITSFVLLPPQTFSRPDSIYILFVIATLYAGLCSIETNKERFHYSWLALCIIFSALAISAKQSGIILPFILAAYFAVFRGEWVKSIIIFLHIICLALGFLFLLMPEHDPQILFANIVIGISQGLDYSSFKLNIIDHFFRVFSLHNAIGLPISIWLVRSSKSGYNLLGWFILVLFGFALLTSLKSGSALNYFTEYIALTGLAVTLWIRHQYSIKHQWNSYYSLLSFSIVFWSVVPNIMNFNWPLALNNDNLSDRPYFIQKEVSDYVKDSLDLKKTDKVFITNHNYCFLNGLLFRNCILPQQEIVSIMYPGKKINYSALDKDIHQNRIRILITRPNETTTAFTHLTTSSYKLRKKFPDFDVYESL